MKEYLDLLQHVLDHGNKRGDRTGTGTISVFGTQTRYDLQKGFPAVTTKKLFFKGVVHELLWMLKGDTNIKYLNDNGVHIWDEWADESGNLGNVYGAQWRQWAGCCKEEWHRHRQTSGHIDQIRQVIHDIKYNPESRRHIVSAWNVGELDKMNLPPCHMMFQFYVDDGRLSCMVVMRSSDTFLGLPFNIASYALLTHMIAQVCDMGVGDLIMSLGDTHIYLNHLTQVNIQLGRDPYPLPKLWLNPDIKDIDDFKYEDIRLEDYLCHPIIKAPIAV